jgi:Ca2+-binding EF-hand superfamily protein
MMKTRLIVLSLLAACASTAWAADPATPAKPDQAKRQEAAQRWNAGDTDKDGAISKQEAGAAKMQHLVNNFDQIDSNKDGKITREEMRAARAQHRQGKHEHMKKEGMMHPYPGKTTETPKP